jgi:NADPH:quinone reductase-like Zn-dependent oxidoreductase
MRAVTLRGGFGLEHLSLEERPTPVPGPGEVLLRLSHASLNYRDLLMVQGSYNPRQELPLIPGSDAVGTVAAWGPGVSGPAIGTRVCPLFDPPKDVFKTTLGGPRDGTLAEYLVTPASAVVPVPEFLDDAEAATLPCAALTAFSALSTLGRVSAGEQVLCLGTGTVSLFALQFARAMGARVIMTSSSNAKLERVKALGAERTFNYVETPEWGRAVREATGGVDHVIEVGGAETLAQSLAAVRPGATISLIGVLAGRAAPVNLLPIVMRQLKVQGVFVGHARSFVEMLQLMSRHSIRPVIGPVLELAQFSEAFRKLESQQHFGKICLNLGESPVAP